MTMIKKLPLTMAVIAAFFPLTSVMAQEFTQEQIDAIVAKAVDKALADRQAKIEPIPFRRQNHGAYLITSLTLRPELAPGQSGLAVHLRSE